MIINIQDSFDKWKSYKIGDQLYYVGLYRDCHTPPIDLRQKYTIISEGENGRIEIEYDGITHSVYRCEMDNEWRGF